MKMKRISALLIVLLSALASFAQPGMNLDGLSSPKRTLWVKGRTLLDSGAAYTAFPVTKTADYTLTYADLGKSFRMNSASTETITVPANATVAFPIGTTFHFNNVGAGTLTVAPAVGVTFNGAAPYELEQYKSLRAVKVATDSWDINFTDASGAGGSARYEIPASSWVMGDARAVWLAHATYQSGSDGATITTPTQQITGGPAISGSGVVLRHASGNQPAYFDPGGTGYWEAATKEDFNWIHQRILVNSQGNAFPVTQKYGITIKIAMQVPVGYTQSSGYEAILANDGTSGASAGFNVIIETPSGVPCFTGKISGSGLNTDLFPAASSAHQNVIPGKWGILTIESNYDPAQDATLTRSLWDGIPIYETITRAPVSTTSAHLLRFFQNNGGGGGFTGKIAGIGMWNRIFTREQSIAKDRWFHELNGWPPAGRPIMENTTYNHGFGAGLLEGGKVGYYWLQTPSHSNYDDHLVYYAESYDGYTVSVPEPVFFSKGSAAGPATMTIPSRIGDSVYITGGVDLTDQAAVRTRAWGSAANAWNPPTFPRDPLLTDDGDATFAENNIIGDKDGTPIGAFYGNLNINTLGTGTYDVTVMAYEGGVWVHRSTITNGGFECTMVQLPGTDTILAAVNMNGTIKLFASIDNAYTWDAGTLIAYQPNGKPVLFLSQAGNLILGHRSAFGNNRPVLKLLPAADVNALDFNIANWGDQRIAVARDGFYGYISIVETSAGVFDVGFCIERQEQNIITSNAYRTTVEEWELLDYVP